MVGKRRTHAAIGAPVRALSLAAAGEDRIVVWYTANPTDPAFAALTMACTCDSSSDPRRASSRFPPGSIGSRAVITPAIGRNDTRDLAVEALRDTGLQIELICVDVHGLNRDL